MPWGLCPHCKGTGDLRCQTCKGKRAVTSQRRVWEQRTCTSCGGSGGKEIEGQRRDCALCGGSGRRKESALMTVSAPCDACGGKGSRACTSCQRGHIWFN
jgi:DnaJ-class molecular chaperone